MQVDEAVDFYQKRKCSNALPQEHFTHSPDAQDLIRWPVQEIRRNSAAARATTHPTQLCHRVAAVATRPPNRRS